MRMAQSEVKEESRGCVSDNIKGIGCVSPTGQKQDGNGNANSNSNSKNPGQPTTTAGRSGSPTQNVTRKDRFWTAEVDDVIAK